MKSFFCCQSSSEEGAPDLTPANLVLPLSRIQSTTKNAINSIKELILYRKGCEIASFSLGDDFDNTSSDIIKVLQSANHCLMLIKDKSGTYLGGFGSNKNGQLGYPVKANEPNHYPSLKKIAIEQIKNQSIIDIAVGDSFSLILIEDPFSHMKKLIRFALTQEEAFILIDNPNGTVSPVKEEKFKHNLSTILRIYADEKRTVLLSKDNKLFIKGSLFNMDINTSYKLFKQFDSSIKDIAFGNNHCLIHFNDNFLIAFGHNEFGELGLKSINPEDFNRHTAFGGKLIRKIACGKRHSLVLCENGDLYAFGDNSEGQCAGNEKYADSPALIAFKNDAKMNDVYCGGNYSIAKSSKGEVYCWGNCNFLFVNEYGSEDKTNEPKSLTTLKLKNIQGVYPGQDQVLFYNESANR